MIKRTCPGCGETRYSADDSGEWTCECGKKLTAELNEVPENKTERLISFLNVVVMFEANTVIAPDDAKIILTALREKSERDKAACKEAFRRYESEAGVTYHD